MMPVDLQCMQCSTSASHVALRARTGATRVHAAAAKLRRQQRSPQGGIKFGRGVFGLHPCGLANHRSRGVMVPVVVVARCKHHPSRRLTTRRTVRTSIDTPHCPQVWHECGLSIRYSWPPLESATTQAAATTTPKLDWWQPMSAPVGGGGIGWAHSGFANKMQTSL